MYWLSMYMKYRFIIQAYTALRLALMTVVTRCQILRLKCTKFDFEL